MNTITSTRYETHNEALHRLLQVAQESGVRLLRDDRGNYWCTSASEPSLIHAVSATSCSCRGYLFHARCRHLAALLSHLGEVPDPDGGAQALPCSACLGTGLVALGRSRWVGGAKLGYRDQWSTPVVCRACEGPVIDADADAEFRCQWEEMAA